MGCWGFFASPLFLSDFFLLLFATDFQEQERMERRKGLGIFKNRFQTFLKTRSLSQNNLQMFCKLYSFCLNLK
jgi:hypothetical protein